MKYFRLLTLITLLSNMAIAQITNALGIQEIEQLKVSKLHEPAISNTNWKKTKVLIINRNEYKNKLKGFLLGSCIANWTGLPTENRRTDFPFFTDSDFGPGKYDYVLDQNPWGADDDTDIEVNSRIISATNFLEHDRFEACNRLLFLY